APVTIIAHEWGRLVQADLDLETEMNYSIERELQADCFAGAWSHSADQEGMVEKGDLDEGTQALYQAGDDINTPWFDPQAHGQPQQRFNSFTEGYNNGPQYCIDNVHNLG